MIGRPRSLVLVGRDPDVRAAIAELVDSSVIRAIDPRHADPFARHIGGLLALTFDAVNELVNGEPLDFVALHTGGENRDWSHAYMMGAKNVWELPAELDWLLAELAIPKPATERNP